MSEVTYSKKELHISVRDLVEFIFREGDIDNRRGHLQSADAMLQGTRIHRKIQKEQDDSYTAEVPLKYTLEAERYALTIEGRADGIFTCKRDCFLQDDAYGMRLFREISLDTEGRDTAAAELVCIDEIKGMYVELSYLEQPFFVHKAQAMCYAYIYASQNNLTEIGVQMTYVNLDTEERRYFREIFQWDELKDWFEQLIREYRKWTDFQMEWRELRQTSIKKLEFPYPYREGQKKLVSDVYRTIARRKNLFIQAPTGVGKTISTIFPAVKAVGEELADRIFYLTAKTITATVAKETFGLLMEHGYRAKIIQLTAKEKLCLCEEMECNPQHCPYAKGHYDRVNDAVFDLLQKSNLFTREEVLAQAEQFQVCPFEMSLDVATWVDDIICDYNYVFDPNVYLKRFFQEGIKGDYIFLVDEAHNLVERSREMYSAKLVKEDFLQVRRIIKPYSKRIEKLLDKCNKILLSMKRECEEYVIYDDIGNILYSLMNLSAAMDDFLQKPIEFSGKDVVLDFYFALRDFLNIYERTDDHYVIYSDFDEEGQFQVKLFCVDPSRNLQQCLDKAHVTIFFSATFLPIHYYKRLLCTREDNYAIYAESTFSKDQRLLAFGREVSTRYTRRNAQEFGKIAEYIFKTISCMQGNYMVFFPSYKLMEQVQELFLEMLNQNDCTDVRCIMQKNNMKEKEREEFLLEFDESQKGTLVAFCVMGGIFGEGIDLKNDRLIGAIVVGTGLPQVSHEREILKNYYDELGENGFDYSFRYPGMNKVLQAAGRVIRTTEDKGVILLLDERFLSREYDALYPREWADRKTCSLAGIEQLLKEFWDRANAEN